MPIYKICDINVLMQPEYEPLLSRSKLYLCGNNTVSEFEIELQEAFLKNKAKKKKYASIGECEYVSAGTVFNRNLINYNGFMLHASAIEFENKAYLFCAPSGTGKSTHTDLWVKHFGKDKVHFINDDKPALMFRDNKCTVCGTPFSGKTDLNSNVSVELQAICFIHRSEQNYIEKCSPKKAIKYILEQTIRPMDEADMLKLLGLIDTLLQNYPVFELGCNISHEAVTVAYNAMKEGLL